VAVIHGGPGAGGEMAPVAHRLASDRGILEPIQTTTSLEGQVEELRAVLENHGDLPATLVGFSWGAWLGFVVAATHPATTRKLILVGSGPFEETYVARLRQARLSRLGEEERTEFASTTQALDDPETEDKETLLARLGSLVSKTDQYDPVTARTEELTSVGHAGDIFPRVWKDAVEMRRSGRLLALARDIECPVVAIHGDYDPHPSEGVEKPLSAALKDFRFILLENCGHKPWIERQAQDGFYRILENELRQPE
jgi:pimeloyl-ACP methyl ester carboxylesterase